MLLGYHSVTSLFQMPADVDSFLFQKGEPADSLVILLEGHVQIVCGDHTYSLSIGSVFAQ